ncbi:MAG: hypothetical protein ACE5IW_05245 [bacterium]
MRQAGVTERGLNKCMQSIKEAARSIRSRDYTPKPNLMVCKYCAFSEVCPATATK